MRIVFSALACAAALASATPAFSYAYCQGMIRETFTDHEGSVYIFGDWRQSYTKICNLNNTWDGIPTQTCFAWFSLVNSSISYAKPVILYYPNLNSCSTIPDYASSPAPYYVMYEKQYQ